MYRLIFSTFIFLLVACQNGAESHLRPSDQVNFETIRDSAFLNYKRANNEIIKSQIYNQAKVDTSIWLTENGTNINEWAGKLKSIKTSHGGSDVSIRIISGRHEYFQTDLPKDSSLYEKISLLSERQVVHFSGNLPKRGEGSFTELGSLEEPEFHIELTDIRGSYQ